MSFQQEQFRGMIKRILKEEVEKRSTTNKKIYQRVPEVASGEDLKKITPHEPTKSSRNELMDDIKSIVKDINKAYSAYWDDHNDITISARDLFKIRIIPKWENNYCIEAFTKNQDRVYITGQNWEQVKEFIKSNLKDDAAHVELAYDKAKENLDDRDKEKADSGMPQKDKPKHLPLTNEKPSSSNNKHKNYTEDQVKNEKDLPNKPMQEVEKFEKQSEHKVKDPVKLRKQKPNTKLIVKQN
jgi:hypothetical protein